MHENKESETKQMKNKKKHEKKEDEWKHNIFITKTDITQTDEQKKQMSGHEHMYGKINERKQHMNDKQTAEWKQDRKQTYEQKKKLNETNIWTKKNKCIQKCLTQKIMTTQQMNETQKNMNENNIWMKK